MPVARVLFPVIAGLAAGRMASLSTDAITGILLILIIFLFLSVRMGFFFRIYHSWIRGVIVTLLFFFLGFHHGITPQVQHEPLPSSVRTGTVSSLPVEKKRSVLIRLRLRERSSSGRKETFFVNAFFEKNDTLLHVRPGDRIIFSAALDIPVNAGNPDEFDYASYLASRKIFYQAFPGEGKWRILSPGERKNGKLPLRIKRKLVQRIYDTPGDDDAKGILAAITLGTRDFLDPELKKAWANAGAVHVMAVSGLHVGMIWMFLGWVTLFLGRGKSASAIRFFTVTGILWFYAVMTGLSASVTRSCLMFSLVSLGKLINRNSDTFNTVMVAAFLQLWFSPALFFDAGFRFSYLAVFGILLFHGRIINLVRVKGFIPEKIRDLLGVSLAAQALTFPLGIFYFHQFPVWFLLTNLIIIPLVTVLVLLYLVSVTFYFFPWASLVTTKSCIHISGFMNNAVSWVDSLPGSLVGGLTLNGFQVCLLIMLPLIALAWSVYRKPGLLITAQVIFLVFLMTGISRRNSGIAANIFMVYNIHGLPAIGLISGGSHCIYTDTSGPDFIRNIEYAGKAYWINHYMEDPAYLPVRGGRDSGGIRIFLPCEGNFLLPAFGSLIAIVSDISLFSLPAPGHPMDVKFLVLAGTGLPAPGDLAAFFRPETIIVSSSVPSWNEYSASEIACLPRVADVRKTGCFLFTPPP